MEVSFRSAGDSALHCIEVLDTRGQVVAHIDRRKVATRTLEFVSPEGVVTRHVSRGMHWFLSIYSLSVSLEVLERRGEGEYAIEIIEFAKLRKAKRWARVWFWRIDCKHHPYRGGRFQSVRHRAFGTFDEGWEAAGESVS